MYTNDTYSLGPKLNLSDPFSILYISLYALYYIQ